MNQLHTLSAQLHQLRKSKFSALSFQLQTELFLSNEEALALQLQPGDRKRSGVYQNSIVTLNIVAGPPLKICRSTRQVRRVLDLGLRYFPLMLVSYSTDEIFHAKIQIKLSDPSWRDESFYQMIEIAEHQRNNSHDGKSSGMTTGRVGKLSSVLELAELRLWDDERGDGPRISPNR